MPATQPDDAGQDAADSRDDVRAIARLPGLDIAIAHRPAVPGGAGERVTVTLQTTGAGRPALGFDPVAEWLRLAQVAWTPWLALANAMWTLPRIVGRGERQGR